VAQAELLPGDALLTSDARLRSRLGPRSRIRILTAAEYWVALGVPRGHPPRSVPVLPRNAPKPESWGWWEY
jgi:hypothetical protein